MLFPLPVIQSPVRRWCHWLVVDFCSMKHQIFRYHSALRAGVSAGMFTMRIGVAVVTDGSCPSEVRRAKYQREEVLEDAGNLTGLNWQSLFKLAFTLNSSLLFFS